MAKKLTKEEVVERIKKVHGDKYDFSEFLKEEFEYKNKSQKIPLICHEKYPNEKEHGIFWKDLTHLEYRKQGCPNCSRTHAGKLTSQRLKGTHQNQQEWIEYCTKKHNGKYDYSLVDFDNKRKDGKIPIICHEKDDDGNEHGIFWQLPNQHKWGKGCKKCRCLTTRKIIERAKSIHGDKYDYSLVKYKGVFEYVDVICKKCDKIFKVTPHNLMKGKGCPYCKGERCSEKLRLQIDEVKNRINNVFNFKYDLSNINYVNEDTPIKLICSIHGEFEQTPFMLFSGHGCTKCGQSSLENEIQIFLDSNNIQNEYECNKKRFKWLGRQSLDFYIPEYNAAIECQGIQHFSPQTFGGITKEEAIKKFNKTIELDKIKKKICEENGIKLLYYSNLGIEYPYEVFEDKNKLLNEIKNIKND